MFDNVQLYFEKINNTVFVKNCENNVSFNVPLFLKFSNLNVFGFIYNFKISLEDSLFAHLKYLSIETVPKV